MSRINPAHPFRGIYPILYAFFNRDLSLDRGAMRRQVEACLAAGADGMAVLGLATEVRLLTSAERRMLMDWLIEDVGGRVPVAITIYEDTAEAQVDAARYAKQAGASWVILQPPPGKDTPESALVDFFANVGERIELPFAIQNAPQYIGIGLTTAAIAEVQRRCANFTLLKGEGSAVMVAEMLRETGGRLANFNGRGGLEIIENLEGGNAGIIPAPEIVDRLIAIYRAWLVGDDARAEATYREILPVLTLIMQGIDSLLIYGKLLAARRMGLPVPIQRNPALQPTALGLKALERWSRSLGPLA